MAAPASGDEGDLLAAGIWRVEAGDKRLGGISGLAVDGERLIAVTDDGALIDLPRPGEGRTARFRDLPDGPGPPLWKKYRDAESLVRDPQGRGWWVGFEFRHSLYLYDKRFTRAIRRVSFPEERWSPNKSFEAAAPVGRGLLALPEAGEELLRIEGGIVTVRPLESDGGVPADAVRLPDGRILVLLRTVRPWGLRSSLGELRREGGRYRLHLLGKLPLGPLDNAEGIAADPRPNGGTRLWIMTDNDFSERRPTLLMALDLPPGGASPR